MRSIWTGMIGFGLVNIPIRLYSPAKEEKIDLDYLHKKDHQPIRYARVCKKEEKEVEWEEIVKGYKINGSYVILTDSDFEKANARKTNTIDIQHFSDESEIDPLFYEKPYYLEPEKDYKKVYALLRDALSKTGKVAVATFVMRSREHLVLLKPYGQVIVLNQLRYSNEVISPEELNLPGPSKSSSKEMEMAVDLIKKSTEKFKPTKHKNEYIKELQSIIKEKAKGKAPKKRGKKPVPTKTTRLMADLEKSLAYAPAKR